MAISIFGASRGTGATQVQAKKRKNMFGNLGQIFFFGKLGPFLLETWAGKIFLETRVGFFLETWVWVQGRPACTCLPLMSFSHVAGVTSSDLRHSRELRKHCQCLNTPHPPLSLVDASSAHLPLWEQDLSCSPEWQGGGVLGAKPLKGPPVWMATAAVCSYLLPFAGQGIPTEYRWLFCGIPDWLKPEPKPVGITRRPPRSTKKLAKIDPQVDQNRPPDRPKSTPRWTKIDPRTDPKVDQNRQEKSTKKTEKVNKKVDFLMLR